MFPQEWKGIYFTMSDKISTVHFVENKSSLLKTLDNTNLIH